MEIKEGRSPTTESVAEWRVIDVVNNIEYRQLGLDTFQLRNKTHIATTNAAGFDTWRDSTESFEQWMKGHNVRILDRTDI